MPAINPAYAKQINGLVGSSPLSDDQVAALLALLPYANKEPLTLQTAELIVVNDGHIVWGTM